MRIKSIQLSWFRGAAEPVSLETACKSVVVYGANGSGKSSFADAVEFVLMDGKIGHLSHEYSGKRQEKAIPNSSRPQGRKTEIRIKFRDDSELRSEISDRGVPKTTGAEAIAINTWDYRRTVLRQDEVAAFIHETKGAKYSALLPLLGLSGLDVAAQDLRQLAKSIEEESRLKETKATLRMLDTKRVAVFGNRDNDQIFAIINELYGKYCAGVPAERDSLAQCREIVAAIDKRIAESSADQRRHITIRGVAALDLKQNITEVRNASLKLAGAVEPMITEKLKVLQTAVEYVGAVGNEREVECPACGQPIQLTSFRAHVEAERARLQDINEIFNVRKAAIGILCDTLKSLKASLHKVDIMSWRDELMKGLLASNAVFLESVDVEAFRASGRETDLDAFESALLPLIDAAVVASRSAPRDVQQLSSDKHLTEVGAAVMEAIEQAAALARAEAVISFIGSLEQGIRDVIRLRSTNVIGEISESVQSMWATLHPGKPIGNVRLYLPADADKAIDIGLTFYGLEQESPRLTLSEGYRNSLGLCIFLAMAKREADKDRPLILDDVVVSLDRNHRGMVAELLEKEFRGGQVILLTHDRDWYTELRLQLNRGDWDFMALMPYDSPDIGIRWSHKTTTFDDARSLIKHRPDAAGNDARKIMDVETALIAERLQIRLPYLRADKNDMRMAHEFLERFIADGKRCFKRKVGDKYGSFDDADAAFAEADRLLVSWGNRASHTFDLAPAEASKLIDACEKAISSFKCSSCGKNVWFANTTNSESVQCQCGEIRWQYGKG